MGNNNNHEGPTDIVGTTITTISAVRLTYDIEDGKEDRRHEERETLDRRRDAKDRRKEPRASDGSGGERDRYRQSPVNGGRREETGSYRGSRERVSDIQQQQQQAGLEASAPDSSGDIPRSERRSGSTRHHRGGGGSGGGGSSGGVERTTKEQRRSPSRDRERPAKDSSGGGGDGGGVHDMQFSRHRILIDHASDTQAEDPRDNISVDPNDKKQHLDPSSAGGRTRNNRKKMESMLRNDSLSSDPSDCVRPPPPKPHKHRRGKKQRQQSLSSSDDEIQSTPECSSCEELDMESESVSEKAVSVKTNEFYHGGDFPHTDERWKKDEILAAKIKKFLSVSNHRPRYPGTHSLPETAENVGVGLTRKLLPVLTIPRIW
ncbi:hypothetical protein RRG08_062761 [Elysia crispata]|uniref:Uncharacterized protein n=1 Tax=Elysia crispata TaxID=231223 RepID=A0AAE1E9S7_9GAST|nr:hypothetical protein RRG08_062761 [Elysia crispata]